MASDRKYRDEEVKEIFDLAVSSDEVGRSALSDEGGLTLAELQAVGLEVGVEPARIAEAALAVDTRRETAPHQTSLGMPVSVGRAIELPGAVTDGEWQLVVAEFREVSGEKGQLTSQEGARGWTGGDLHAVLEPTETGHRLRLRAQKDNAVAVTRMGAAGLGLGLLLFVFFLLNAAVGDVAVPGFVISLLVAGWGGVALAPNVLGLPRWAHKREGQMEYLAGRVQALVGERPPEEDSGT